MTTKCNSTTGEADWGDDTAPDGDVAAEPVVGAEVAVPGAATDPVELHSPGGNFSENQEKLRGAIGAVRASDLPVTDTEVMPANASAREESGVAFLLDGLAHCVENVRSARGGAVELLVSVHAFISDPRFELAKLCAMNGLACTKATEGNPALAVIQIADPDTSRKIASDWGNAIKGAQGACKNRPQNVPAYLRQHGVEGCLRAWRESRETNGSPPRTKSKGSPVPEIAAHEPRQAVLKMPVVSDGSYQLLAECCGGVWRLISHALVGSVPGIPAVPRLAGGSAAQQSEVALDDVAGGPVAPAGTTVPEFCRGTKDGAAGSGASSQRGVPMDG